MFRDCEATSVCQRCITGPSRPTTEVCNGNDDNIVNINIDNTDNIVNNNARLDENPDMKENEIEDPETDEENEESVTEEPSTTTTTTTSTTTAPTTSTPIGKICLSFYVLIVFPFQYIATT